MFELSVVTPQGPAPGLEAQQVDEVTAPGVEGEFGVLPGHIPFISATKAGVLSYRRGGERGRVAVGPGYVEVDLHGAVTALVRRAVPADKASAEEAQALQHKAEERLRQSTLTESERKLAQDDLAWAQALQDVTRDR